MSSKNLEKYFELCIKKSLSDSTIKAYKCTLNNLEKDTTKSIDENLKDEDAFFQFIQELQISKSTKIKKISHVLNYIKIMHPKKVDGIFIDFINEHKNTKVPVRNINTDAGKITLKDLQTKYNSIDFDTDLQAKLVLGLLLNKSVLRNDLANVHMNYVDENTPYFNGTDIIFPTINKVKIDEDIVITLTQSEIDLIKQLQKQRSPNNLYLIDIKYSDRSNGYSKYITNITLKYFEQKITQLGFRHISITNNVNTINPNIIEENEKLNELCKKSGHSLTTMLKHYYDGKN